MANLNDGLSEAVSDAVEGGYLHKAAFGHMIKLTRMESEKREDFLRAVEIMSALCRQLGLWQEHTGDIVDEAEAPMASGEEFDGIRHSNVEAIRGGIKELKNVEPIRKTRQPPLNAPF